MKMVDCPSCDGDGAYMIGLSPESGPIERKCHQCNGSGKVETNGYDNDDEENEEDEDYSPVEAISYEDWKQAEKEAAWEAQWEYDNER